MEQQFQLMEDCSSQYDFSNFNSIFLNKKLNYIEDLYKCYVKIDTIVLL